MLLLMTSGNMAIGVEVEAEVEIVNPEKLRQGYYIGADSGLRQQPVDPCQCGGGRAQPGGDRTTGGRGVTSDTKL